LFLLLRDVRSPWLFAVCAPLGIALHFNAVPDAMKYTLGTMALAVAVTGAPHAHFLFKNMLSCAPVRWFGLASYSMYLWQQPFALTQMPRTVALSGAILCGAVSFYLVEAPLRRMLTQRREGMKAATIPLAGDLKQVGSA
jgi:peptidoglycan/LPS O-acetylase OafA/YrhL